MSEFKEIFNVLKENPTTGSLESFAYKMESLARMQSQEQTKLDLIQFFVEIGRNPKVYEEIIHSEAILRFYKLLGSVSKRMGAIGLYTQLEIKGTFSKSLKFHLQWAEEYAKTGNVDEFARVLNLARKRLSDDISNINIEAGFRDIVDSYPIDVRHIFLDPDDTMTAVFALPGKTKAKTKIRSEFVDSSGQYGVSPEEFRLAIHKDDIGEDMDIEVAKKRKDSGIVPNLQKLDEHESRASREAVENRMKENRRRQLSMVDEEKNVSDESEVEKKARIYSPVVPTRDAHRLPLRSSIGINEKLPETITISSDTKTISTLDDVSFDNKKDDSTGYKIEIDNEKLKTMSSGRLERSSADGRELSASSSTKTAKSGTVGLELLAENNCLDAHAMFSETVHLRDSTMAIDNMREPNFRNGETARCNITETDFSVLCDPDPTFHQHNQDGKPKTSSSGLNMVYDEKSPLQEKEKEEAAKDDIIEHDTDREKLKSKDGFSVSPSSLTTPPSYELFQEENGADPFDESILSGFSRQSHRSIVTSTPAVGYVDVEEYFGNPREHEEKEKEADSDAKFVIPSISTKSRLSRRVSVAPTVDPFVEPKKTAPKPEVRIEDMSLSEQLERRCSLGTEELSKKIAAAEENELEETGIKNRRRSEVMRGDINPWDADLQMKLMRLVRPPTYMHEYQTNCPKIQAMKPIEAGGEKFNVHTILGQGGYAKVYKATNEDKKIVAIKYEVPPCNWEVYICDQMRHRLLRKREDESTRIADLCIMEVIDAYIFTNASLLVNDYCEYGTLLEYVNNTKDPNWHISLVLLYQMAKIVREVHSVQVIHGDIKPDNFMITRKIDLHWNKDDMLRSDTYIIKLIDWGRSIDMATMKDHTFSGRAGTEGFDCPEMIDGRPWTYQADFFAFAASMAVIVSGKYCTLAGSSVGNYSLNVDIKRRNVLRDTVIEIIDEFLNIKSCTQLPSWDKMITSLETFWENNFDNSAWRSSATKFNEACVQAMK